MQCLGQITVEPGQVGKVVKLFKRPNSPFLIGVTFL